MKIAGVGKKDKPKAMKGMRKQYRKMTRKTKRK